MIGQQLTPVDKKKSFNYSEDLKFDHLKLRNIWNPDIFSRTNFKGSGFSLSYSDKLKHMQVVVNCQYSIAQMYTHEDTLAHILGTPYIDDVMSHNELTTLFLTIWNLD